MKRMTPAANLLLRVLTGKYKHFARKGMLAANGSFYCHDKYLMEELYISDNTIKRARIFLKETGEIDYVIGKHKGVPTQYWILSKGAKMEPFEQDVKGAKMSAKGANLVVKGSQNGTLYNKELKKESNKNIPDTFSFSEEEKDGIRAFAKSYGVSRVSALLLDKGCDQESIKQMFEGIALCKQ